MQASRQVYVVTGWPETCISARERLMEASAACVAAGGASACHLRQDAGDAHAHIQSIKALMSPWVLWMDSDIDCRQYCYLRCKRSALLAESSASATSRSQTEAAKRHDFKVRFCGEVRESSAKPYPSSPSCPSSPPSLWMCAFGEHRCGWALVVSFARLERITYSIAVPRLIPKNDFRLKGHPPAAKEAKRSTRRFN